MLTIFVLLSCAIASASAAEDAKVTELMTKALDDVPGKEVTMITVEYAPGGKDPVHRHNAATFVYVLEGSIIMQMKGGEKVTLHPGQTFYEDPKGIHLVGENASKTKPAKFVALLVKEQGASFFIPVTKQDDDLPVFHRKGVELITIMADIERGYQASLWLYDYFQKIITERRADPRNDLISVLAQAELEGQQLTDDEIIAFLRLLLPAGAETTYRSSSNLMYGLLSNPDQLEALRKDRSLMPQAIEEGVRWEPPLTSIGRTAARDVEIEGVLIPKGSPVSVCMASANRDESRWENPDAFDIFRDQKQHMSFAFGPHMCLGMHLARMETSVAINAILDLPNLRLDPAAEDVHISGLAFRAPAGLPVLFD